VGRVCGKPGVGGRSGGDWDAGRPGADTPLTFARKEVRRRVAVQAADAARRRRPLGERMRREGTPTGDLETSARSEPDYPCAGKPGQLHVLGVGLSAGAEVQCHVD
jgi:hypothetical protein